ncbi:Baculoviral IAP repeat-containing protein 5.2 [Trichinella pseudospiralis]|uniref:Baculoviral IAP repeat-containing protein 5.2 n=2 Tax=Trichinella pseudospiralis TaxID=6337 RepID=A0A0V1HT89_TRIPS|nr:Baculoviral IAP repeat-containing protein 5.2 [Trichinella pseudospiralis]KRY81746.1 Baculoviral IAP repeat-containing protein 5.2 [Trichinella pseudospiralis]KRZ13396.1 Baculoviral IAP repeat-containing protein 5.2 [Trichinella pseudospiralis]KRZ25763.1 Baculoviral IAP repeat-containing protein 5.2 [Trichinella pseudospiralis]
MDDRERRPLKMNTPLRKQLDKNDHKLYENCIIDNMARFFDVKERLIELYGPVEMALESNRLSSFVSWPYTSKDRCNKQNLAKAGFYYDPIDSDEGCVRCFFCLKELHDWQRNDNPWDEHVRHTIKKGKPCPFIELGKAEAELTVGEFFQLTNKRLDIVFEKLKEEVLETFDNH